MIRRDVEIRHSDNLRPRLYFLFHTAPCLMRMIIAPSLLAANFGRLAKETERGERLRRRLAAPGHHGRPFRAEHLLWPGGGADASPADASFSSTCI